MKTNQVMVKRLIIILLANFLFFVPTIFVSIYFYLIMIGIFSFLITIGFLIARSEYDKMEKINNEFEEEMNKEGKKVTTLNAEDSWNFITKGVAFIDNKPIFLKESHLWQSKKM